MSTTIPWLQLPWINPERTKKLIDALSRRILVIDGAMGTMVQGYSLVEDDYRGERFAYAALYDGRDDDLGQRLFDGPSADVEVAEGQRFARNA